MLIIMNRKDLRGCPRSFTICLPSCSVCMIDELTYGISCSCLPIMTAIQATTQHSWDIRTENIVLRAEQSELNARLQSLKETIRLMNESNVSDNDSLNETIRLMSESNDGEGGRIQS
ncbi:hypothetical protein Gotur_030419 [Gossypium turneri]